MTRKNTTLRIIVKTFDEHGKKLTEVTKDNDIFLWNWGAIMAAYIKANFKPEIAGTFPWKNIEGVVRTTPPNHWGGVYGYIYSSSSNGCRDTMFVQIGSGTTAPAISDHKLETFVAEATPTPPEVITLGNLIKITFTTTFNFPAETQIAETGIRADGFGVIAVQTPPTAADRLLITRDTFTPATVPANGTVSIQHELWLNGTP